MQNATRVWILVLFIGHIGCGATATTASDESITEQIRDSLATEEFDWHDLVVEMQENGINTDEMEETLSDLANHPVVLNGATKEALESIPFLSDDQIENLSYYLYRFGPMVHFSELLLVEGMDARLMRWLKPFVTVGGPEETILVAPPLKKAFVFGKQEIRLTAGRTLQEKAGFIEENAGRYVGDAVHGGLRYGFDYKGLLQWGIVLEKDPGERWWNGRQGGFDFTSLHFVAKDPKRHNAVFLGDYTVRLGQGLVCGNAFSLGKSTGNLSPELTGASIQRHYSASEINFLRGVALRFRFATKRNRPQKEMLVFLSRRLLDADVEQGCFGTVTNTGLHRTEAEINHQNRLGQWIGGYHFGLRKSNWSLGFNHLNWLYDYSASTSTEPWRIYQFQGRFGSDVSLDFRGMYKGFAYFGEGALDQTGHGAFLSGVAFKPYSRMDACFVYRKYSPAYHSILSNSLSEGTAVRNEEGLYATASLQLYKNLHASCYLDLFRFPWLAYGINAPSFGQELALELRSTVGKNGLVRLQIKHKDKEQNNNSDGIPTAPIETISKTHFRLQMEEKQGIYTMKSVLIGNQFKIANEIKYGIALAQDLGLSFENIPLILQVHTVLFNTDSWDNRLYVWEKDLPGTFSMPLLYGHGTRLGLFVRYDWKNWELQFKLVDEVQPDKKEIGSGNELIQGSHKTEFRLQLRWNI